MINFIINQRHLEVLRKLPEYFNDTPILMSFILATTKVFLVAFTLDLNEALLTKTKIGNIAIVI